MARIVGTEIESQLWVQISQASTCLPDMYHNMRSRRFVASKVPWSGVIMIGCVEIAIVLGLGTDQSEASATDIKTENNLP